MNKFFKDLKPHLAAIAGSTGFTVGDPKLKSLVELAQERIMMEMNPPQALQRLAIQVHDGVLTLPDEYDTLYSCKRSDIGVQEITDAWYTLLPQNNIDGNYPVVPAEDLGESAVYRHPEGRRLKAYSEDSSDITVYADNETVTLTPGSRDQEPTLSAKAYFDIQRVERAANGKPFDLVYEDLSGVETFGGRWSGYWESSSFRSYNVGDFTNIAQVVARRRVIPITGDNSPLVISNLAALRLMIKSIHNEDSDEDQKAELNLQRALAAMRGENSRYHPHNQQPRINIQNGFGDIASI